ncbi:DUF1043 family protein [Orbus sturtevantii]|uniref:YhcB family protein n=1 Tax=Orbus sturtevantii TaxID=3074109 RepID=UPI00370D2F83
MDSEMTTYLIMGLVLGAIIGIIITNVFSSKARKYEQMKRELEVTKQELATQKQMIIKHFSHSAEILDNMAKEFRRLYQHMADNSNNLVSQEDLNTLNLTPTMNINTDKTVLESKIQGSTPPKDYSNNPSGLLKGEETKI